MNELQTAESIARQAFAFYSLPSESDLSLLNHSENITFTVTQPGSLKRILRVHRPHYHTRRAVWSELQWMAALKSEAGVSTPDVIVGNNGEWVQEVHDPNGKNPRLCVMFTFLQGQEPNEESLLESFPTLGKIAAIMHDHSSRWTPSNGFWRQTWDWEQMFGNRPIWGRWQDGMGMDGESLLLLERLERAMQERILAFGQQRDRFGLIHADMRLANLLAEGNTTHIIDFDDCGFGWFLYDLATALSFIEDRPDADNLIAAWFSGYKSRREVSAEEEAEAWTFIMMRRLLLVAWIASHSDTDLAREKGADFTRESCVLAEKYLSRQRGNSIRY